MEKGNKLKETHTIKQEVVKIDSSYEQLDENLSRMVLDKYHVDVNNFLVQLFNTIEIERNVQKIINPTDDYIVKFTPELLKRMEKHDVRFLRDRLTGELLPDLYDYTDKGIGGKIRLEVKKNLSAQDIVNLNNAINNLIEQQRYENLVKEIHKLNIVIKRIERGQDFDRFAKVNAGRKHLLDALKYNGTEEEKKNFVRDALAMLRQGKELIEITLLNKLNELDEVPKGKVRCLWKCFSQPEYFDEQTKKYNDIQEYFEYYYKSIQSMAYAYTYLRQPQLIEGLLEDCRKVFEHKNLCYLSSIEYLYPDKNYDGMWYKNPKQHEQKLLEVYKERDTDLYITIKGYEILEVFGNGSEK